MTKRHTIEFNAKITPVKPLNEEFTLCKCYVMALGKNRNLSYISEETATAALPTLFNIPVIGHLYLDDEGNYHMGGHDIELVKNPDGQLEFKSLCVPYGVVPQQDGVHYEDIKEPNGDINTYLVADIVLWTGRYPELYEAIYDNEIYFGHSMEINVVEHSLLEEDKNYVNILDYSYSALCLLGKSDNPDFHTEPCFPMSRVEPYEFSLDDKFSELMSRLKTELALCFDNAEKGGESMNENETIVTQQTDIEENFEVTEEAIETVETKESAENFEETNTDATERPVAFSSTYREKREAIENALPNTDETDEDGNLVRSVWYWLCDFDETHAFVEKSEYVRGDSHTETKGRFAYTFNEEDKSVAIVGEMEEMFVRWLTKDELDQLDAQRAQYEELVEYKASRENADREAEFDAAIEEFAYLAGNEEFDKIYENRYSYASVEELKDACYIIKGKYSISAPQRKNASEPEVAVGGAEPPASIYERFHERFGRK